MLTPLDVFDRSPQGGLYIDSDKLLQLLQDRARVYAEKAAEPGLDPVKTELWRGQRLEALKLELDLREALKQWQNM